ncbi:MAG: type I DNA topoisomerase [Bacteroidia bacterium]|nr:type I DNA topoisomerase [Bacteroidia bacterium]MCF8447117.1 type I DNA topoisomerase [Bacteroidia bacterium]
MSKNLVIVESPAKAKTIEKFLGKDFTVKSCFGHIRDLSKGDDAIDVKGDFTPSYEVSDDKKAIVAELKKLSKEADLVWLASDEDREGEAISWHLSEVLNLTEAKTRRIVFHEITKPAILRAIESPRGIDKNLVDAQQARRVLDRLVGFELSPVLWKKVKGNLSAGRVQSVAVRLIVDREREINVFEHTSAFRVIARFNISGKQMEAELGKRFATEAEAKAFLDKCVGANFTIKNLEVKPSEKSPAPPFTTSTLQQEASRKIGYGVSTTMSIAQKLYENGLITYMRTDSVNLSELAIESAKEYITGNFGPQYSRPMRYTTKNDSAQEAHEAIRPTYFENVEIEGTPQEKRLYDLIYKRAIASQMSKAQIEKTIATISISGIPETLAATGEVLKFDGFLKVYLESTDDDQEDEGNKMLPPLIVGEILSLIQVQATEKFTRPAARYTEASLVKRLEELGIGRPSTYAPTISTIQKRGYVLKEDREGKERNFIQLTLQSNAIERDVKMEKFGSEKSKLFPSDIGMIVTDFLGKHFEQIMDFGFTASVEEEFDKIARGQLVWNKMIEKFYGPFHATVTNTSENAERQNAERTLGIDPESGKTVYVKVGRYGPYAQIGENSDDEKEKPRYASLRAGQLTETITLAEAMELFKLPRLVGTFETKDIKASIGRFGPYLVHNSKFISIPKTDDVFAIDEARAIELIEGKRISDANKLLKVFPEDEEVKILNGRWGPYIAKGKENYRLPKTQKVEELTFAMVTDIIAAEQKTGGKKAASKKAAPVKKVAAKKTAAKKTAAKKVKK